METATNNYKQEKWSAYIDYLHNWEDNHKDFHFEGMSPVCYDEWCDCELGENKPYK